ncbi:J domain-containing protein [Marixanthomonas ophiurae]|uniref:J domain-containing protein n=1 Tax=Marixanthomonas ophiurae TaxID=387659 RepID=UPI0013143674|nr:DnaJ domain-containing protein [Marixanthomonas ophiurae]
MFKDYYSILKIPQTATQADIKLAFKTQALKWHPDKNVGKDTTMKMQEINEAYLILRDGDARRRYDIEYSKYKDFKKQNRYQREEREYKKEENTKTKSRSYEYEVEDETLEKWMRNARRQAVDLAKQTLQEIVGLSVEATKKAGSKMFQMAIYYAISGFIIMLLFKACN